MTRLIERAQGSTTPIRFRIESGDTGLTLTGATVTMWVIDRDHWLGEDFDPPYHVIYAPSSVVKVRGGVCVIDADQVTKTGEVSWTPGVDDLDTPGTYWMQPRVAGGDGSIDAPPPMLLRVYPTIFSLA